MVVDSSPDGASREKKRKQKKNLSLLRGPVHVDKHLRVVGVARALPSAVRAERGENLEMRSLADFEGVDKRSLRLFFYSSRFLTANKTGPWWWRRWRQLVSWPIRTGSWQTCITSGRVRRCAPQHPSFLCLCVFEYYPFDYASCRIFFSISYASVSDSSLKNEPQIFLWIYPLSW